MVSVTTVSLSAFCEAASYAFFSSSGAPPQSLRGGWEVEPYTGTYADIIARGETFVRCLACGELVLVGVVD